MVDVGGARTPWGLRTRSRRLWPCAPHPGGAQPRPARSGLQPRGRQTPWRACPAHVAPTDAW